MSDPTSPSSSRLARRDALRCMALAGAGTVFALCGGVLTPLSLADARERKSAARPLFVQISDTHIGFHKEANPDVDGTLNHAVEWINALPAAPQFVLHTGDITHLSKPEQFDRAASLLGRLRVTDLHTVPGEHDVADADVSEYFRRFGAVSNNRGYYAFDQQGVHFIGLNNVMQAKDGGQGGLGDEQLRWVLDDLKRRSSSTPIVVFAHMPLWSIYEPWGWATADAAPVIDSLRRFGSVSVLNGHIHQIVQKEEGHIRFHTARSTAFPQPAPGQGPGPGPLKVDPAELAGALGVTSVTIDPYPRSLVLADTSLADAT